MDSGDSDKAFADWDQAIKLDPTDPINYYARGTAYYQAGEYDLAIADFDKAIQFGLENPGAYFYRGLSNLVNQCSLSAGSMNMETGVWTSMRIYFDQCDTTNMITDFDQAIAIEPGLGRLISGAVEPISSTE